MCVHEWQILESSWGNLVDIYDKCGVCGRVRKNQGVSEYYKYLSDEEFRTYRMDILNLSPDYHNGNGHYHNTFNADDILFWGAMHT